MIGEIICFMKSSTLFCIIFFLLRFDEQYNRYDPYNFEDHYLNRRHYDPYDSYSPQIPRFPDPYYIYPDRRYDVPEPRASSRIYNNELFDQLPLQPPRYNQNRKHRRIIYYAHLPEIVRGSKIPIYNNNNNDDSRYDGIITSNGVSSRFSRPYKINNSAVSVSPATSSIQNQASYDFVKREKKDHVRIGETSNPIKSSLSRQ